MTSALHQVLCAAIAEWQRFPGRYASIYHKYLGVFPPVSFDECAGGRWAAADELEPILKRRKLRIGHVDAAPYVFRAGAQDLRGIDYETGQALTAIVAGHYEGLSPDPEWVLVGGSYGEESSKFQALYDAMRNGDFDVAVSGQANIGDEIASVDWLCATDLCFTNLLYSGRDHFDLGPMTTRDEVVAKLKTLGPITIGYVGNNPGPSSPSAENLERDIGENVTLMKSQGAAPLNEWMANQECHFSVGDGIASSWLALAQWPKATNFNIQVALPENPPQQVAGFTMPE